jgi:dienelactone hydrolase
LSVDLFSQGNRARCMMKIFYGMLLRPSRNGTVADLCTALDFLRAGGGGRVAGGGHKGGTFAPQLAGLDDEMKAVSVFYGMNPRLLEVVAQGCPIVGGYPADDFTAGAARRLEPMLERYDVPHDNGNLPSYHAFVLQSGSNTRLACCRRCVAAHVFGLRTPSGIKDSVALQGDTDRRVQPVLGSSVRQAGRQRWLRAIEGARWPIHKRFRRVRLHRISRCHLIQGS